tara:strand:+ start:80 stop:244 length:165 start_codon:yes stop_codon:yes gene_type:complete
MDYDFYDEIAEKSEAIKSQWALHTLEVQVKNRVLASIIIPTLANAWFQHIMRQV